ncbi:MAG: hypothetical protein R3C10_08945 [Pirellulales bacterium]
MENQPKEPARRPDAPSMRLTQNTPAMWFLLIAMLVLLVLFFFPGKSNRSEITY